MGKHNRFILFFFTLVVAMVMAPGIIAKPMPGGNKDVQTDEAIGNKDVQIEFRSGNKDDQTDYGKKDGEDDYIREKQDGENDKEHVRPQYARKTAMDFGDSNSTRRVLTGCSPTNPIDNCWRCKPDWADNRQAMGQCALGFGKGTTGGCGGEMYVVKDPSDDDPANPMDGTLRFGAIQNRPLWITFEKDMVISPKQELLINCNKTIDGRGAKVEICNGGGLTLANVTNVIIHGLTIRNMTPTAGGMIKSSESIGAGPRVGSDGDAIQTFSSSKLWVDHCSLSGGPDGLIDVTMDSTAITISNCLFTDHDKAVLLGANDEHVEDKNMKVTLAYNKFSAINERMPMCRWGFFQVVNNDYCNWGLYAIAGCSNPTIISQGNRYMAPDDPYRKQVTMRNKAPEEEWRKWNWRTQNDLFLNGAFFVDSGADVELLPEMIPPEPADSMDTLTKDAGALTCCPGSPC